MVAIAQPSRPDSLWAPTDAVSPRGVTAALGPGAGGIPAEAPDSGEGDVPDGAGVCRARGILAAL
jgi:hypothetical protein